MSQVEVCIDILYSLPLIYITMASFHEATSISSQICIRERKMKTAHVFMLSLYYKTINSDKPFMITCVKTAHVSCFPSKPCILLIMIQGWLMQESGGAGRIWPNHIILELVGFGPTI